MAKFKVGDLVQLKSSGPVMTITSIERYHKSSGILADIEIPGFDESQIEEGTVLRVTCQWFAGKTLTQGKFYPESLVNAETDER